MPPPSRGWRGSILGLAAWYSVVLAHVAVAGSLPSVGSLIATGGMAALVGTGLAGRALTWSRAFVALLLLQPALHLALTALAAGHQHHAFTGRSPGSAMVLAHVVAAALTALLVSRGEQAVLRLAQLLATFWRRLAPLRPVRADHKQVLRADADTTPAVRIEVSWSVLRRGPPLRPAGSIA